MPDRKKVLGHLNDCIEASRRDNTWVFVRKDIVEDALALLKEQEVRWILKKQEARWISVPHKRARICSHCEADEPYKFADDDAEVYEYCPHCGAKMTEGR